ncbi:MAG: hypothetical protein LBJ13_02655 [Puniceicoccales bacterium]|jgi:hypothetical protein|nr:hypothetical protein [Puniceicoccales bacterium]
MFRDIVKCVSGACCAAVIACTSGAWGIDREDVVIKTDQSFAGLFRWNYLLGQVRSKYGHQFNASAETSAETTLENDKTILNCLADEAKLAAIRGDKGTLIDVLFLINLKGGVDYCKKFEDGIWTEETYREKNSEIKNYSANRMKEMVKFLMNERAAPGFVLSKEFLSECQESYRFGDGQLYRLEDLLKAGK